MHLFPTRSSRTVATLAAFGLPLLFAAPFALAAEPTAAAAPAKPAVQKRDKPPKGTHRNTRFGFQFRFPRDWENIAIKTEEEWLGAKYRSDQKFTWTHPDLGWTYSHSPELLVIVFPHEVMKKGGENVEKEKSEDGEDVVKITITNPYRDYDDFLQRTYADGGYFKAEEEEDEIDGVKVTKLLYKAEKLARTGPKTISTWIYHAEDVDYAVQVVGLADHWDDVEKQAKRTRRSFELIERDGPIEHSGRTADQLVLTRLDLGDSTPEERRTAAKASEVAMHSAAIEKLPDRGWKHEHKGRVLMLTSADDKWSDRVMKHTNNLLDWLDEEFGYLTEGEYMRQPIVRVCKDRDEAAAFTAGVTTGGYGGMWSISDEFVTWWDDTGWTGYCIDNLSSQIYRYWMMEKNLRLQTALPSWIDSGLQNLVSNVRMDGRKPDWRRDDFAIERFRDLVRSGNADSPRSLFLMTSKEYNDFENVTALFGRQAQAEMLISYLLIPEIRRKRSAKGLLEEYLKNMVAVIEDIEKEREAELDKAREKLHPDKGEGDYLRERRKIFSEMEKELLQRTFDRTFGDWSDSDWKKFTKDFHGAFGA
ncbi:MAG: hypothetical protein AAF726_01095 [Planctomycetota bacterium]